MKTIREDFGDYYTISAVDDRGRLRWRRDGTARFADSRYYAEPEVEVLKPSGGRIDYSKVSKGIV